MRYDPLILFYQLKKPIILVRELGYVATVFEDKLDFSAAYA